MYQDGRQLRFIDELKIRLVAEIFAIYTNRILNLYHYVLNYLFSAKLLVAILSVS